jgi:hypothetical protein
MALDLDNREAPDGVPRAAALHGGSARWIGASGRRYTAEIYPLGLTLPARPGVLILAKPRGPLAHSWTALYVGAVADARGAVRDTKRHPHLWNFAVELGLTAIHLVTAAASAAERHDIARDLIRSLLPSLNRETASMQRSGLGTNLGVTT